MDVLILQPTYLQVALASHLLIRPFIALISVYQSGVIVGLTGNFCALASIWWLFSLSISNIPWKPTAKSINRVTNSSVNRNIAAGLVGYMHVVTLVVQAHKRAAHAYNVVIRWGKILHSVLG